MQNIGNNYYFGNGRKFPAIPLRNTICQQTVQRKFWKFYVKGLVIPFLIKGPQVLSLEV